MEGGGLVEEIETDDALSKAMADHERLLYEAMDDDFNTAKAIACLYDMAGEVHRHIEENGTDADVAGATAILMRNARLLGLFLEPQVDEVSDELAGSLIELLIDVRKEARVEKQFALSDMVRDRLKDLGIQLKDSRDGTTWEKV